MEAIRLLSPHLDVLGAPSSVACLDSPSSAWLREFPAKVHALGAGFGGYGYRRGVPSDIRALALQHDVVVIHGLWQYHTLATRTALRGTDIPYFVFPHGMLDPWFRVTFPFKHLKKCLYWPFADYQVLRDAQAVLFTCDQERLLARRSFRLYRVREQVVGLGTAYPPGVAAIQRAKFLECWPQLSGKKILLFLGRLHPKKGVDILIQAFASVANFDSDLHLVIAGPDTCGWLSTLKQLAESLNISDRVTWAGMLAGDGKWGAFYAADLFCLPSHQENFGIAVAEALACGLPVCVADPVNISDRVRSFSAGLVHSDTAVGTSCALKDFLRLSEEQRRVMASNASDLFSHEFEITSVAKKLFSTLSRHCPAR